ncbi:MAG: PEGA domain-containing protein [Deltaproteobacteria bacterium]|nr:PEGA domain-containing protein [Deltaproteobacteria bacterium]
MRAIRSPSIPWFTALFMVLCAGSFARAEGGPKVRLLPYQPIARQATPELCTQITNMLAGELGGADAFTLSRGEEAAEEAGDAPTSNAAAAEKAEEQAKAALDKALTLSQAGAKQVQKQKFDPAIKTLTESLKQFEAGGAALTDVSPVVQTHINVAVAMWKRGMEDDAQLHLAAAARLDPDFKLDPKEYWPLFLRVYDQQWRRTLRQPRGKVRVEATVPGAEVFWNGKSVGAAPTMLTNAVPGAHYLRVVKEGAGVFAAVVDVKPEGTVEITADLGGGRSGGGGLGPVANAVAGNLVDEAAFRAARELGKSQGAAFVLFGGVQKKETGITVATFMVNVEDGKVGRLVDLELDLDLLSASVEAFKLVEEVGQRIKDFGEPLPAGASPVVRGVEAGEEKGITEIDIGPPVPEGKAARDPGERKVAGEEGGEDEGGGRRAFGTEDEAKKPKVRKDSAGKSVAMRDDYKTQRPFYLNPLFLGAIGAAVVVGALVTVTLVAGAAVGGGTAGFLLLTPPQSATVEATWP